MEEAQSQSIEQTNAAGVSLGRQAWQRLKRNKLALVSAAFVLILAFACFLSPFLDIKSFEEQNLDMGASGPSKEHWLGTDTLGRDLFSRIIHGGRISLAVGFAATFVSLTIGVFYGTISGFIGGRTDAVMMRIVDILFALPFTVFVILLMVLFGRNIYLLFIVIGAVEWLTMARIVRGQVMALRHQAFVDAAITLGAAKRRIILRHMIPNVLGVIIVYATLTIPAVMLLEAFLSFLGFGVQPPQSSWGTLINEGAKAMEEYPWMLFFPALFFSATLFSLNFLGDGLRDALDVRSRRD